MLTLIHGNDLVSSRKFFIDQKNRISNGIVLSGDTATITDLAQILEGGELFTQPKNIYVEQLLTKKKKNKERDALVSYLITHSEDHGITLWEDKELDRATLTTFKTAIVRLFNLPQVLFSFLDTIKPGNTKSIISLFHQSLATTEPEMIFFMLVRQFRLLLALSPTHTTSATSMEQEQITELKRLAPWQKTKLQNQAKALGVNKIVQLYKQLFEIEVAQKTGTLSGSLTAAIDFLLLAI